MIRVVKRRGPAFDARASCPFCSMSLGVRAIRPGQRLLAEHSVSRGRIWPGEPRCDGSAWNTSDEIFLDGVPAPARVSPHPSGAGPGAVHLSES